MNKQLASIILVVFVDLLGFSLVIPLLPYYAETFRANTFTTGLLVAVYALAQLIGAPILGRLSDRYGRRPMLLASVFGTFLGFLLLGFANALWMLFASRIIDGVTGGNLSIAQAYISDVTDAKNRAKGLGMIGAAFGLGFVIGPAVGGLLSRWGYAVPAFAAATLAFANMLLIYFWLKESRTPASPSAVRKASAVSLGALLDALRRPFSGSLLISRFVFGLAFAVLQTIFPLFALARFKLPAEQTAYVLAYVGVLLVVTQGFLVGRLSARFREDHLIIGGLGIMIFGLLGWAWVPTVPLLLVVMLFISVPGGVLNTVLSSTLTKAVSADEQGGILGLSTAIESSTRILAPLAGAWLLQQYGTWAPGLFSSALLVVLIFYTARTILNHEIVTTLGGRKPPATA